MKRSRALARAAGTVMLSAFFWYILLAAGGALLVARGVAVQYGGGPGMMTLGALAILGSEILRNGLRHRA